MGERYSWFHSIKALKVRTAIGDHRIFVRPAIAELTVRPCHRGAHSKAMPSGANIDQSRSLTIKKIQKKIFLEGLST